MVFRRKQFTEAEGPGDSAAAVPGRTGTVSGRAGATAESRPSERLIGIYLDIKTAFEGGD